MHEAQIALVAILHEGQARHRSDLQLAHGWRKEFAAQNNGRKRLAHLERDGDRNDDEQADARDQRNPAWPHIQAHKHWLSMQTLTISEEAEEGDQNLHQIARQPKKDTVVWQ